MNLLHKLYNYKADENDFDTSVVFVTFPADEFSTTSSQVEILVPISVTNDSINEASEVFSVRLQVENATSFVDVGRSMAVCKIRDDDRELE